MSEWVIDTSALVSAMTDKSNRGEALADRLTAAKLHAPHLIDAELGNVLRRQVRRAELSDEQARGLLRAVDTAINDRYPHGPLSEAAWQLRENLSYYDALYVALAARLDLPLLTADKRLAAAPGLPCTVTLAR